VGLAGKNTGMILEPTQSCFDCGAKLSALIVHLVLFAAMAQAYLDVRAQASLNPPPQEVVAQLNRAIYLANRGDLDGALQSATQLAHRYPGFVPALKLQGVLLEQTGQRKEAAEVYRQASLRSPNDADLLFKLAKCELAQGDNDQAISAFVRYLKFRPGDGDAMFYLSQAYHLRQEDELALATIRSCLRVRANSATVWQKYGELLFDMRQNDESLHALFKAQRLDPGLKGVETDMASTLYAAMDFEKAALHAEKASARDPRDIRALVLLGLAEEKLSDWPKCERAFGRALAIKNDDVPSLLGLGHCELEAGQYQAASTVLNQVVRLDPSQSQAHYFLSRALTALGNSSEAKHQSELFHMMQQMSLAPAALGSEGGKAIWNDATQLLNEHKEDEALRLFEQSSKGSARARGDAYVFVGSLYLSMGKPEDAVRMLHEALRIEPTVRGAHTYLGMAELQQNRLDDAEKEFRAELANDPNYLPALGELGEVSYRRRQWGEAADLLSKSRTSEPSLLYMLCDAYFHMGDRGNAILAAETLASYAQPRSEIINALQTLLARNGQSNLLPQFSDR
jgi:tetratricopeptide (TPR) repeat protein